MLSRIPKALLSEASCSTAEAFIGNNHVLVVYVLLGTLTLTEFLLTPSPPNILMDRQ